MKYEVKYKLNENETFTILVNLDTYVTSLTLERGVSNLCKNIQMFINKFSNENDVIVDIKLSNEDPSLGIIINLWKGDEDSPFGVAHYMFDDYNY
jgi:hypothetical protein